MEQTVNQFTKGLQMDTNPMIQGSDTLTDALNATLVTMNGNEVILQNDMGFLLLKGNLMQKIQILTTVQEFLILELKVDI